jgi:hypothetical protein
MLEQYRFNNRFQKEPEEDDLFTELEFYRVEGKLFPLEHVIESSNNDLFFEEIGDIEYEFCYDYEYTYTYSYHFKYEYTY